MRSFTILLKLQGENILHGREVMASLVFGEMTGWNLEAQDLFRLTMGSSCETNGVRFGEMRDQLTLANEKAAELIAIAERMFGPMSSAWKYAGVTFRDCPPHLYYFPEMGLVQISLSYRAMDDDLQRDFQLAHEVCHLLYPAVEFGGCENPKTNVLNEGVSTYFSIIVIDACYSEEAVEAALGGLAKSSPKYFSAFRRVLALMQQDQDAIKKIRAIQPMINKVCSADLRAANLQLTEESIDALIEIC